ncbi:AsmA family protein [Mesorhizobium sp. NBSH29]|uniref:AsmA family protein n=1 Tax=Mesorhizobium sp. NBSH29 TaxID=2654249 RepID=UPI0021565B36|nr:AsmA family protein [Mesorhizobium sp. NBSH29]
MIAALAALLAVLAVLFPMVASTRLVSDRIALEMSAWSGYRVSVGAPPEVTFFPIVKATLRNVTLSDWRDTDAKPIVDAERVEVDLSPLAALVGKIVFSDVRLIRPTLRLVPSGQFYLPAPPGGGRVSRSIGSARAAIAANPESPALDAVASEPFGKVEFTDGRIVTVDGSREEEAVTSISGLVDWSATNRSGKLAANGIWRGENVAINLSSANPVALFAGGSAALSVALKSNSATMSFEGSLNASENPFVDGQFAFASPSIRRLMEWLQSDIAPKSAIGSISIKSHLTGNAQRVKFENTELALDGNPGTGLLDVSLEGPVPNIAGTLAFETLNLGSFLSALTPLAPSDTDTDLESEFASRVELDLRLSAAKAAAGTIGLTQVAATVQVKNGLAMLDVSDATAFGGTLQAGLRLDHNGPTDTVELRMLANEIDGAIFAAATGMSGLMPTGRGTISAILKGPAQSWRHLLENADGSITANFGAGELKGLNIPAFLERAARGGFFALTEVSDGSLPIKMAEVKASINRGVVTIEKAEAKSAVKDIWLGGLVPYIGGGLALSGKIFPPGADKAVTPPDATFFVGGSWSVPFISPILQLPPQAPNL